MFDHAEALQLRCVQLSFKGALPEPVDDETFVASRPSSRKLADPLANDESSYALTFHVERPVMFNTERKHSVHMKSITQTHCRKNPKAHMRICQAPDSKFLEP